MENENNKNKFGIIITVSVIIILVLAIIIGIVYTINETKNKENNALLNESSVNETER